MTKKSSEEFGYFAKITLVLYLLGALSVKSNLLKALSAKNGRALSFLPPHLRVVAVFIIHTFSTPLIKISKKIY